MSRLVALYPRPWRDRYEDELLSVLAARPISWRARLDLMRGAMDARLDPQLPGEVRVRDRAGLWTLAGLGLLVLAMVLLANGPVIQDEYGSYADGGAALLPFVAAVALLSFGIARLGRRLPASASATRFWASLAIACGTLWSLFPWTSITALGFLGGLAMFGIGAARARVLSRWAAVALAAALAGPTLFWVATFLLPWYELRLAGGVTLLLFVPIVAAWPIVGLSLLRGPSASRR
jgi:hypothetical protein